MNNDKNVSEKTAKSLLPEVFTVCKVVNGTLTKSHCVPSIFGPHFFNHKTGEHGAKGAIIAILTKNAKKIMASYGLKTSGKFAADFMESFEPELIAKVLECAMTTEQINNEVQLLFPNRYSLSTIKTNLSIIMFEGTKRCPPTIGKLETDIKINGAGQSTKPLFKFYLIVNKEWALMDEFEMDMCENSTMAIV